MKNPIAYIHRKLKVPVNWSEAQYTVEAPSDKHPLHNATMTLDDLYGAVRYIHTRQKVSLDGYTVHVVVNGERVGRLRKHCMQHLYGHLHFAVTCGDRMAIQCGQSLRRETAV